MIKRHWIPQMLLFVLANCVAGAVAGRGLGLNMTCAPCEIGKPLAPNYPIWVSLTIMNSSRTPFVGYEPAVNNHCVWCTAKPLPNPATTVDPNEPTLSEPFAHLTLNPGQTVVFDILLNDCVPIKKNGKLSLYISAPLYDNTFHEFILSTPFSVDIGDPAPPAALVALRDQLLAAAGSGNAQEASHAMLATDALSDEYALPVLDKASQNSYLRDGAIVALGLRPRTSGRKMLLIKILDRVGPETKPLVQSFLNAK